MVLGLMLSPVTWQISQEPAMDGRPPNSPAKNYDPKLPNWLNPKALQNKKAESLIQEKCGLAQ